MVLLQQYQRPRTPTLPFNGQDLPQEEVADLLKTGTDSAAASLKNASDAAASQQAASLSEKNAAQSEQNAATSEENAAISESNAYDHEIAAATAAIQTAMYLLAPMYLTESLGRAALVSAGAASGTTFMVQGDGSTVAAYEYRFVDTNTVSTLIASYAAATAVLVTEVEDTAANIASAASVLNTVNKFKGKKVWDLTNKRLLRASGTTPTSSWDLISGGTSVIPS
jgi:hypothetical protein